MSTSKAKAELARLTGLYRACLETDRKLSEAAQRLDAHHAARAEVIAPYLSVDRDDDLALDYLDSVLERHRAAPLAQGGGAALTFAKAEYEKRWKNKSDGYSQRYRYKLNLLARAVPHLGVSQVGVSGLPDRAKIRVA